jgi:cysteine desulfurase
VERAYFDHNASSPVEPGVLETFVALLRDAPGNASSIHHDGQIAKQRLEMARRQLASLLHCDPKELVFTSGGTESDNLALFGVLRNAPGTRRHLITTAIEHPAVLRACAQLEREGVEVTCVPVSSGGIVDPSSIRAALRPETVLISVMHANNETGAIQPVQAIAEIAHDAGVFFHIDGVQAFGKIPVRMDETAADLYSISGHKAGAPKGIGALFVKKGSPVTPLLFGGRHEHGLRAGTENVPAAAALGRAAALIEETLPVDSVRIRGLRDRLERGILAEVPHCGVNAHTAPRLPNTTSIYFDGIEGEAMVISLDLKGFSVSSGSACSSGAVEPSHVLLAMGLSPERARSSLRFSLGRTNTDGEVDRLIAAVASSAAQLRRLSPTYSER